MNTTTDTNTTPLENPALESLIRSIVAKHAEEIYEPILLVAINEPRRESNRQREQIAQLRQEVGGLTGVCLGLTTEIQCMEVREGYEKRNLDAREATAASLALIAGIERERAATAKDQIEATEVGAEKQALATLYAHSKASPPLMQRFFKLLGF